MHRSINIFLSPYVMWFAAEKVKQPHIFYALFGSCCCCSAAVPTAAVAVAAAATVVVAAAADVDTSQDIWRSFVFPLACTKTFFTRSVGWRINLRSVVLSYFAYYDRWMGR